MLMIKLFFSYEMYEYSSLIQTFPLKSTFAFINTSGLGELLLRCITLYLLNKLETITVLLKNE
jgi:hypothetical protein